MPIGMIRIALIVTAASVTTAEAKDDHLESQLAGTDGHVTQFAPLANRRPVVIRPIRNQRAQEGSVFRFRVPDDTFADPDGESMTIRILENVDWLSANQKRRTVSGTPLTFDNPATVRVRATDRSGASTTTTFRVSIRPRAVDGDAPPAQSTKSLNSDGTDDSTEPSISADGRFVAHLFRSSEAQEESVVVRDFTFASFSGRGSLTVAGPSLFFEALFSSPSISADGRVVAFAAQTAPDANIQGTEIRVLRIADGDPLDLETKFQSILDSADVQAPEVSLSADGRIVAFEQGTGITVAKIGTRRRLFISNASSPSLSRNGRRLAYEEVTGSDERAILVGTLDTGRMSLIEAIVIGFDTDDITSEFDSSNPVISGNGNFVAFESAASDLVAGDTNAVRDIFVLNLRESTSTLRRVSVDADGDQGATDSSNPSISANGRFVAFDTDVPNVEARQVLVRRLDRLGRPRGELRIASVDDDGAPGNAGGFEGSLRPSLSADGRFVTFESSSTNLTPDAAENAGTAVFIAPAFPNYAPAVDFSIDPPDDDPPDDVSTPAALEPGAPRRSRIDPAFDADWYRVELIAEQSYRFELRADDSDGTPLGDPFLELRDASGGDPGGVPTNNDDGGGGLNGFDALLDFTALSSGTFFVVARGRIDETGDYVLSVVSPPPAVTVSR